jgi:hypothetical protein
MHTKREILEAVINGDVAALNQLPRITLLCTSDNKSNGIYQVRPPYGQNLPPWAKPQMNERELEAVKSRYQVALTIINKTY